MTINPLFIPFFQVLPKECDVKPTPVDTNVDDDSDEDESGTNWDDANDDDAIDSPSFPEFHRILLNAIEELGGSVFPKTNWSAPRDASWIGFGNSLRCSTPEQVCGACCVDRYQFSGAQYSGF